MHIILANISSQTEKPWHKITIDKYMNAFTNHFLNTKEYVTRIPKKKNRVISTASEREIVFTKKSMSHFLHLDNIWEVGEKHTHLKI